MLPKPTYTGGSPASRNASSSAGSGRSSGRIHAPVCTTSRSAVPSHGPRVGSAASHGWSVNMNVADVVHRRQADRGPVGVDRRSEQRVPVLGVRVVQHVRREEHVPVRDAQLLGHRLRDEVRHGGRQEQVASLGCLGDRVVLRGDELGHPPGPLLRPSTAAPTSATAGRTAPAARRHPPAAPRTPRPAARTPAPPRRAPATAPPAPPSVRRPRATRTSTTTPACVTPPFPYLAGDSAPRTGSCRKPPCAL